MGFPEIVSSLLLSIISSDLYQGKENIYKKCQLYFFRRRVIRDLHRYINCHDGSVLTTGSFEHYLEKYNVVEKMLAHVLGDGDSIAKIDYLKGLVNIFVNSGQHKKCWSVLELNQVFDFLRFLYDTVDVFCRKHLSYSERYSLQIVLSAKTEIKEFINSFASEAMKSLHGIENNLNDLKDESSFRKLLESVGDVAAGSTNAFHYLNSQMIKIYGRNSQLALLNEFLDSPPNYSFCVITGPGGIGKSKLAFSFMQQEKDHRKDWNMCFVNDSILSKMANCEKWNHNSNTLLIVDYAGTSLDLLHKIFVKIAECQSFFKYKLRIILLDRVGMTKKYDPSTNEVLVEYPYWYSFMISPQKRDVYADTEYISKFLFSDFIELEGLSEEDYKNLINDYAFAMSKRESNKKNQVIYSLSPEQISEVIDFSRRSSNSLLNSRPLYIMLATDAIINGRDISCWDTTQMMQYIYDRDRKQWQDNIQDDLILCALENALTYSTIFGEWSIEHSFQIGNRCVSENIEKGLKMPDKRGPVKDWLAQMCEFQDCDIWSLKMQAYEPDIVGEFYVLKQLESCIASKDDWYELIFANLSKSKYFLERACQDYANTNLAKILVGILNALTSKASVEYVVEAECVIRIWELFYTEVEDKTLKGVALTGIQTICNKLLYQSRLIDETNIRFFYANPAEHTNSWREHRFTDYKQFYKKWPDSPEIVTAYIEVLGEMASWYYRNGNVPKGNAYSKTLNSVISRCSIYDGGVLVSYIDALGSIISGHYYMNDDANVEAEIDDEFKLETLVAELKTEAHAIAYIDAIKKTIVQQSKYTEDHKIVKSIEQFCKHINEWMEHEDWYVFRWNIGSVIPFAVDLLFTHKKRMSGENLFDNYLELIEKYIKIQYKAPNLMISHFSTGLDKLIKSPMIPEEVKAKICKLECI